MPIGDLNLKNEYKQKNLALPRLNGLTPTIDSTLLKMVEEIGELSQQLEHMESGRGSIRLIAEELLDLAQTVVTLMFVFEDAGIKVQEWVHEHLEKLRKKGYLPEGDEVVALIKSDGKFQYLFLPQLDIEGVTLDKTLRNINKAMGRLACARGKFSGMNKENIVVDSSEVDKLLGLSLLHVAQCCYTMMYVLRNEYGFDMDELVQKHIEKLEKKGYIIRS